MPKKTIYIRDEDKELFTIAEALSKQSLSALLADLLNRYIDEEVAQRSQSEEEMQESMCHFLQKSLTRDYFARDCWVQDEMDDSWSVGVETEAWGTYRLKPERAYRVYVDADGSPRALTEDEIREHMQGVLIDRVGGLGTREITMYFMEEATGPDDGIEYWVFGDFEDEDKSDFIVASTEEAFEVFMQFCQRGNASDSRPRRAVRGLR